jgi:hypothetical protein
MSVFNEQRGIFQCTWEYNFATGRFKTLQIRTCYISGTNHVFVINVGCNM